ncbi:hypothetical protein SAMN04487962_12522 [Marinobacter segnicrescens]|uniref:Uncharacterized protein n=1 Tax=Marinobacter segnicrescens TaxID=430453 RepID=A0A1I0H840_9GAMM|nr:hypothetical protein [Marinobacter segnicrescens]SET79826.1 hypothetical protein SAMN04487962_12522 [Marinobacter segnicrescens]
MARDYDELEKARTLTADDIAAAVTRAIQAQKNAEMGEDWDQKHCKHHEALDNLLPHIDDLVSYIEVVKKREERRQRIYEKITGTIVISGILSALGFIGKLVLGSSGG